MDLYRKAFEFVQSHFDAHPQVDEAERQYRFLHTKRVTHIGRWLTQAESLNQTVVVLGCILHDVGKFDESPSLSHAQASAEISRPFLLGCGLPADTVEEICHGVALHSQLHTREDRARYTVDTLSVADCDDIDRYGAYNTLDFLRRNDFFALDGAGACRMIGGLLEELEVILDHEFSTGSATSVIHALADKRRSFYRQLYLQLETTADPAGLAGYLALMQKRE